MKKSFALLALVSLMALAGCNKTGNSGSTPASNKPTTSVGGESLTPSTSTNTPSVEVVKTALQTPVVTVSTQVSGQVTWEDVEHAAYYLVYVNDDTDGIEVVGTSYKIPLLDTGLSAQKEVLLSHIVPCMEKEHYGFSNTPKVELKCAELGNDAGIIGAASLLM